MTNEVVSSLGDLGYSNQLIIGVLIVFGIVVIWLIKNIDDVVESLNKLFTWKQRKEELKALIVSNAEEIKELKEHDKTQEKVMLDFKDEVCESMKRIMDKLDDIEERHKKDKEETAERIAIEDRSAIIAFASEEHNGAEHLIEHYKDIIRKIDSYESYCLLHQKFKNGEAVLSIEQIRKSYQEKFLK